MTHIRIAETKFLEVYIMETLKWNTHKQSLANKWSKVSFMIKSLKDIMSSYTIHNIYFPKFQLIYSLEYYFWGGKED